MTTVRLRPLKREPPRCANYADEHELRRFERAMRAHRADTEPFVVEALEGRVDGAYRVRGESGNEYYVDIVDGGGQSDTCTCPDFLTNDLGTCKHAEAVRRAVAGRRAWRALYARLPAEPAVTTVGVRFAEPGRPAPALLGPVSRRALARGGLALDAAGWVEPGASAVLRPGRDGPALRVTYAAPLAYERWRQVRALRARRAAVAAALGRGRLGVDVLRGPLFPYQRDGVAHLVVAGRGLLADDMGLGKTVQAIAACEVLRARGEASRVLVVAPTSLKHQWAAEIERHAGERAVIVGGGGRARAAAFRSDAPYKILNYELTWRELRRLQGLDADVLVLDEAQRAKNFRTKTAATLRAIPSRFLFVLTGTPVENRLDDLYALLQLADPALLGPLWRFNREFHEQNERGRVTGYKNLARLRERIAPFVLRRRKEAVLDQLPPLTEQYRYVPLDPRQAELEAGLRSDAAQILAIAERRALTKEEHERLMKLLLKARQACNALELADPDRGERASPKLDEFESFVAEIAAQGSSKLLVFSEWVGMLRLAAERLVALGVGHLLFHGGVPAERRGALLDRFRHDPDLRVLLCSDAGGVGLNLQVATYVVHLDLPWNPARLDQRTPRRARRRAPKRTRPRPPRRPGPPRPRRARCRVPPTATPPPDPPTPPTATPPPDPPTPPTATPPAPPRPAGRPRAPPSACASRRSSSTPRSTPTPCAPRTRRSPRPSARSPTAARPRATRPSSRRSTATSCPPARPPRPRTPRSRASTICSRSTSTASRSIASSPARPSKRPPLGSSASRPRQARAERLRRPAGPRALGKAAIKVLNPARSSEPASVARFVGDELSLRPFVAPGLGGVVLGGRF
ncbi:MAG TPA: DEAD/DEAH box helicase [Polyangiaceae bacterium]|nr:DEAD/DEAH box helicase [Polyangiaceae bacterium]